MTRIVFWGSPALSAAFLEELYLNHRDKFCITACVTQPEKEIRRQGKSRAQSAVHSKATSLGIPVFTPNSLKDSTLLPQLTACGFDLFLVLAYGKILPQHFLQTPPLGALNFHASLLPLLRGASPIEHALLYGLRETGWTLQRMAAELDAGDIIAQSHVPIADTDTAGTLYQKMLHNLLAEGPWMLEQYASGRAVVRTQEHHLATYCGKIRAEQGLLDFSKPAGQVRNHFRAFSPRPGVFAFFRGQKVKLEFDLQKPPLATDRTAGSLIRPEKGVLAVACGDGRALFIATLTPEGKRPMPALDFINGYRLRDTDFLGSHPSNRGPVSTELPSSM